MISIASSYGDEHHHAKDGIELLAQKTAYGYIQRVQRKKQSFSPGRANDASHAPSYAGRVDFAVQLLPGRV